MEPAQNRFFKGHRCFRNVRAASSKAAAKARPKPCSRNFPRDLRVIPAAFFPTFHFFFLHSSLGAPTIYCAWKLTRDGCHLVEPFFLIFKFCLFF